jgi:nucleoid-associated protein YgaU
MEEYIVQYGDTLKTIGKEKLGDEQRWFEIVKLNNFRVFLVGLASNFWQKFMIKS